MYAHSWPRCLHLLLMINGQGRTNVWRGSASLLLSPSPPERHTGSAAQFSSRRPPPKARPINAGSALPVFHRPWAAERERNMSCVYSHACVSALAALALAVYSIPLLIVAYFFIKRVIDDPRAAMRVFSPLLLLLGVLVLSHSVSVFIAPDLCVGLVLHLEGLR